MLVYAGGLLLALAALAFAGILPALADYTYPLIWWGALPLIDEWNFRRRGLSLWRGNSAHFLSVTVPVSVLLWLLFEVLNLFAPQWRYRGAITSIAEQTVFGFVAFSTVIPIMVEAWWLLAGPICLPVLWARRHRMLLAAAGIAVLVIPFFNNIFWFNQGMWLGPALLLLPLLDTSACTSGRRFAAALVVSSVLAGIAWEASNYWARTKWEYLILPDIPHLFEMPLPGYLGFIPFALTVLVVYEWQRRRQPRWLTALLLWMSALTGLSVLTAEYMEAGLWVFR